MMKGSGTSNEAERLLRDRYSPIPRDENEKIMEGIQKLLVIARDPVLPLQAFLDETVKLIHRLFDFKEVAIGTKSKSDNLFRYNAFIGTSGDAQKAGRKLAYTYEEMTDSNKYPGGVRITKKTEFMLVELHPFKPGEEDTFNRPSLLKKDRPSIEDIAEGDYIDIYFFGRKDEVIGWIELAGTRTGKMPSRSTIRWLELISSILASVISERDSDNT